METVETTWQHVRRGAVVLVRGRLYKVVEREPLTILDDLAGERWTGTPGPHKSVTAVLPTEQPVTVEQAVHLVTTVLGGTAP
jgi:hypothetical protein